MYNGREAGDDLFSNENTPASSECQSCEEDKIHLEAALS